mmetsp:Transcript_89910/g.142015  ORF Transcript_89910/g.142015 Transcript_89910/m.142015 type:complete len:692 (-) Transcript_89910:67-2142(-)|eukprot:CAMPEP_0169084150 /NCGR_PEP_ID=MMETSP1015-20121227/12465_1 /TAXON_ID=342587 /ORGANISM="Karlodinium micrum, Strain CCMP2283" /LENGTH=691 /DNA_ID=CAMNT_0009144135 /DNA_START=38 /DNA_END=2113 /DNA_ORIENTATION=+
MAHYADEYTFRELLNAWEEGEVLVRTRSSRRAVTDWDGSKQSFQGISCSNMLQSIPTPSVALLRKVLPMILLLEIAEKHPKRMAHIAVACVFLCLLKCFLWPRLPTLRKLWSTSHVGSSMNPVAAMLKSAVASRHEDSALIHRIRAACVADAGGSRFCPLRWSGKLRLQMQEFFRKLLMLFPKPPMAVIRKVALAIPFLESAVDQPRRMVRVAVITGIVCFCLWSSRLILCKLRLPSCRCSSKLIYVGFVLAAMGLWSTRDVSFSEQLFSEKTFALSPEQPVSEQLFSEKAELLPGQQDILDDIAKVHPEFSFSDSPSEQCSYSSDLADAVPAFEEHYIQESGESAMLMAYSVSIAIVVYGLGGLVSFVSWRRHNLTSFAEILPESELVHSAILRSPTSILPVVLWASTVILQAGAIFISAVAGALSWTLATMVHPLLFAIEWCASSMDRSWAMDEFAGGCIFPSVGSQLTQDVSISGSCPSRSLQQGCATKRASVDADSRKKQKTDGFLSMSVVRNDDDLKKAAEIECDVACSPRKCAKHMATNEPKRATHMSPEDAEIVAVANADDVAVVGMQTSSSKEILSITRISLLQQLRKLVETNTKAILVESAYSASPGSSVLQRIKKLIDMKRKVQNRVQSVGQKRLGSNARRHLVTKSCGRSLKRAYFSGISLPMALLQVAPIGSGRQLRRH